MKCSQCNEREATSFYKQTVNGQTKEFHLCESCLKKLQAESPMMHLWGTGSSFGTLWKDMLGFSDAGERVRSAVRSCPRCGLDEIALRRSGLVGCADCYRTFADILSPYIKKVHGADSHISALLSANEQVCKDPVPDLREKLRKAVESEQYEEAARIRDELRRLEAK